VTLKQCLVISFFVTSLGTGALGNPNSKKCRQMCGNFKETETARGKIQENPGYGEYEMEGRIIAGYSPPYQRGFTAIIRTEGIGSCSGSIISNRFILTAAHCVCMNDRRANHHIFCRNAKTKYDVRRTLTVLVGMDVQANVNDMDIANFEKKVDRVKVHEKWEGRIDSGGSGYDIALIRLDKELEWNGDQLSPICLAKKDTHLAEKGYAAGYGTTKVPEKVCLTDNRGPARLMPCQFPFKFKKATYTECQRYEAPDHYSEKCKQFRNFMWTKKSDWSGTALVKIQYEGKSGKRTAKCYPPNLFEKYGWCGVKLKNRKKVTFENQRNLQMPKNDFLNIYWGGQKENWGYCGPSCEESESKDEGLNDKLQETQLSIIPDEDCKLFGLSGITFKKEKEFCTGMKHKFQQEVHFRRRHTKKKDGNNKRIYKYELMEKKKAHLGVNKQQQELDYYLGFSDTCLGDSGGPFFQFDEEGKAIQTGLVASGSDKCSAMNQPAIMTNLKKYTRWIKKHAKKGSC